MLSSYTSPRKIRHFFEVNQPKNMKHASFRFYEELNDFLPVKKKKVEFDYFFEGNPSIKDVIQAIGVPHVEIELILVNGFSVNFKYPLQNDDHVSVYPVFETFDITELSRLREKPLRDPKFILDVHLGKLTKYLRLLGFDTLYRNDYSDRELISVSTNEHRTILTRDIGLLKMKDVSHGYFIRSQNSNEQVIEVLNHFHLKRSIQPFNRCIKCNNHLERVDKESIMNELEPLTKKYYEKFFKCKGCKTIFWEGSHYNKMKSFIETIINQ